MLRFSDALPTTIPGLPPAQHTVRWMLGAGHANPASRPLPARPRPMPAREEEPLHIPDAGYGDLIDSIYATVGATFGDSGHWPMVLDHVSKLLGADQTFLLADGGDSQTPSAMASHGSDPEALKLFLDYYASVNVFAEPADRAFRAGETRFSHWVVADADLERTEFYQDFLRRFGMYYSFGVKISMSEERSLYLSCQRSKERSAFTPAEGRVLQSLRPHLERASRLQQQTVAARCQVDALLTSIDAFGHAVFGLDRKGRVTFCTERARQAVRGGGVLELRDERLRCVLRGQTELVQQLFDAVKDAGAKTASRTLFKADGDRIQLVASSVPHGDAGSSSSVLVYLCDPAQPLPSRTRLLVDLYRLTPIEARMCQALLCGFSVQDASHQLRITVSTCRFHLKSIFAKTGVRRQPELILMLSSLPSPEKSERVR